MEADGSDLKTSRPVDFSHVFPNRACADAFARQAHEEGFATIVEEVEHEDEPRDVTASKEMTPSCENITSTEEHLDSLVRALCGRADGWGFFNV